MAQDSTIREASFEPARDELALRQSEGVVSRLGEPHRYVDCGRKPNGLVPSWSAIPADRRRRPGSAYSDAEEYGGLHRIAYQEARLQQAEAGLRVTTDIAPRGRVLPASAHGTWHGERNGRRTFGGDPWSGISFRRLGTNLHAGGIRPTGCGEAQKDINIAPRERSNCISDVATASPAWTYENRFVMEANCLSSAS